MTQFNKGDKVLVEIEMTIDEVCSQNNIELRDKEGETYDLYIEQAGAKVTKITPPLKPGDIVKRKDSGKVYSLLQPTQGHSRYFDYFIHATGETKTYGYFPADEYEVIASAKVAA